MTNLKGQTQELLLIPPKETDFKGEKPWLIGMWLSPATKPEALESRFNVIPYHWEDRVKLELDVELIKGYIKGVKKVLYPALNEVHHTDYSAKYWNVLVGEWVYLYTQIIYDRWSVVNSAFNLNLSQELLGHPFHANEIPFDTNGFQESATTDHEWNASLLIDMANQKSEKKHKNSKIIRFIARPTNQIPSRLIQKRRLTYILLKIYASIFPERKEIIVQTPYLDKMNFIKLCLNLKGLMYFKSEKEFVPSVHYSRQSRKHLSEILGEDNEGDSFSKFLIRSIVDYLPAIYLEHFSAHKEFAEGQYFNSSPNLIVTANSHYTDETWKSWAASASEKGARIVLLQHGGHYGHSKFSLIQDYEIELADKFLSWGWANLHNEKVIVAPATKLIGLKIKRKAKNTCLVVTFESSLYAYWLASIPIGPQVINSKEMTMGFLSAIKEPLRQSVRVRTYPIDYGLNQRNVFKLSFSDLSFSSDYCDFKTDLKDARIVVFNYFSTSFIEAIKMGIPSVVFINPAHWEVEDSFTRLFSSLADIGVLHYTSDSCAHFVEQIWDSVDAWWSNSDTIEVIGKFLRFFGYTGPNPIKELSNSILEIREESS